ncbi:FMN-dependent NADH-azoreductase [Rugamonas sp. FT82W]|uniref:FMN dependent NADH:quinone oxidoreductase n=1 Tax=Duganella vulcania TaxID=2692166 RepID=A0A845G5P5_9BURK|nr:FMN-dependent NADH-azoreductase [Duganella vulcania]MYM89624.1 FMN-dependent NADH-azoreductase [Duganella vulcania]
MNILHLDSSILADASTSRLLSSAIVGELLQQRPNAQVVHRDLVADPVAHLTGAIAAGFRAPAGAPVADPATLGEHARSAQLADEFLASEVIVIGAPMYNFSVASQLKAWIDRVAQPGRTFRYTADGPVGLSGGRRVIVASTRGGMYSAGAAAGMDFQESYLKAFFGFLGIGDVQFVRAERLTKGAELRELSIGAARAAVRDAVTRALMS